MPRKTSLKTCPKCGDVFNRKTGFYPRSAADPAGTGVYCKGCETNTRRVTRWQKQWDVLGRTEFARYVRGHEQFLAQLHDFQARMLAGRNPKGKSP